MLRQEDDSATGERKTSVSAGVIVVAVVAGIAIGAVVMWAARPGIRVYEGRTTFVDANGTAFGWQAPRGAEAGYSVAGTTWRGRDPGWHIGDPGSCLVPGHRPQAIRIGVMTVPSDAESPGGDVVVWLACLDWPTAPG